MTVDIASLVNDNLDTWTTAVERKSGAGRGGGRRTKMRGIELLRSLILDLAIRGRLLPQDKSDQPAAKLVEQARIALPDSSATIGRQRWRPSKLFTEAERKRPLPSGWAVARVNDIGFYINGLAFKPSDWGTTGRPIIRIQNLTNPLTPFNYATGEFPDEVVVRDGDILVSWSATLATYQWRGDDAILNQHIFRVIPAEGVTEKAYLRLILEQAIKDLAAGEHAHGLVMTHINRGPFLDHIVLIPPLAEQQRIVAKVDELVALCDALEAESAAAMAGHQTLVEALLATLTASTDTADLATNWSRLEAHFNTLFTTEASVNALKQTILELAVRGKLVSYDQQDAPASTVVQSWKQAKRHSLENAGDHRIKAAPKPTQPPFALPSHWEIQSFENIFLFVDYRGNTPPKTDSGIPLITAKNVRMGYLDREPREYISESTFHKWMTRGFPAVDDLFFTTEAPLGNICLNDIEEPFAIAQRLICFKPYGPTNTRFFMLALMSRSMQRLLNENATGMTAKGIKAAKLKPIPLPVPPEAEQARIVAKVDELMTICDALKARITDAAETQKHFADAIVERAAA